MSSISSSDRARQDDKIRQTREEYENREAENAKKRKAEVTRLEKRHHDEINKISESYEDRIEALKSRNRDVISEKDAANNRKIEEVRNTYRESLKNRMEDNYNDREQVRNSYEGALKKQKEIGEAQKENLVTQLNDEIGRRDENYTKALESNRKQTQQTIQENARKLNTAHEKERDTIAKGHEDVRGKDRRELTEMRKSFDARLRESERRREADNSRWAQKYKDTVVNNRDEYGDTISEFLILFIHSIGK